MKKQESVKTIEEEKCHQGDEWRNGPDTGAELRKGTPLTVWNSENFPSTCHVAQNDKAFLGAQDIIFQGAQIGIF